jgi:hypothetical protein
MATALTVGTKQWSLTGLSTPRPMTLLRASARIWKLSRVPPEAPSMSGRFSARTSFFFSVT